MKSFVPVLAATTIVALCASPLRAQWSTDTLSEARTLISAATVGDLAFFAGGTDNVSTVTDVVDVYDAGTDSWSTANLSTPRAVMGVAVLGDRVFFAGGGMSPTTPSDVVDIYDASLGDPDDPAAWSTASLSQARSFPAGTSVGTKVFFAGGDTFDSVLGPMVSDVVDIYDASLGDPGDSAAWSVGTPLSQARTLLSATTAGDQAIFAGGLDGNTPVDTVDIYDDSTGLWSTGQLFVPRTVPYGSATSVGSLAFFAGGQLTGSFPFSWSNVVDVYNAETGLWTTETMSIARGQLACAAVGNTVLFAGGATGATYVATDAVEFYDVISGQWGPVAHLSQPKLGMAPTSVAGKALFAGGGFSPSSSLAGIDVHEPGAWTDLGGGTPGVAGTPWLNGTGSLVGGTTAGVALKYAPPGALSLAWIALASTPFSALGGTVHAFPYSSQLTVLMDGEGSFSGATTWPVGLPMGTQAWFQFVVQDATSMHGITLSNGVLATTP